MAGRLRALAAAEQAKVRAAPDTTKQGATSYVFRVLELAEVRGGSVACWRHEQLTASCVCVCCARLPLGALSHVFISIHSLSQQDKVDTVLEALSYLELPPDVVIEVFLSCSSASTLTKLGTKVRGRRVTSLSMFSAAIHPYHTTSTRSHVVFCLCTSLVSLTAGATPARTSASAACSSARPCTWSSRT